MFVAFAMLAYAMTLYAVTTINQNHSLLAILLTYQEGLSLYMLIAPNSRFI